MYSPEITERFLEAQKGADPSFRATRHSLGDVDTMIDLLGDAWDPEEKRQTRRLTADEILFIDNERLLCTHDFDYFSRSYCFIIDFTKRLSRFKPNVAQRIVLDIWSEMEAKRYAIMMLQLKARQLGVSTLTELAVLHRLVFWPEVDAVVASSTPDKSGKMAKMIRTAWDHLPWWLRPTVTRIEDGLPVEFREQHASLEISAGNKFSGVARGSTPNVFHGSEICEWADPKGDIDAALLNAVHETPEVFFVIESTALGRGNWFHYTWMYSKEHWGGRGSKLCPIFLPFYVGRDIYPDDGWILKHPVPDKWQPSDRLLRFASRCEDYTHQNTLLRRHLGQHWVMPKEQLWWYDFTSEEYRAKDELNTFLSECCVSGDTLVSTSDGMIPIAEASAITRCESGDVSAWMDRGVRDVMRLTTKGGRELVATPDHRVKLSDGSWKQMAMLLPDDDIALVPPIFASDYYTERWQWAPTCDMAIRVDEDWGFLLGLFVGDGHWAGDAMGMSCFDGDSDTIEECARLMKMAVGRDPTRITKGHCVVLQSNSVKWWEMLWNLGVLDRRFAKKQNRHSGYTKRLRVPPCIFKSPKPVVAAFLRGLFEADGHANRFTPQTTMFTKDPVLMRQVQYLLMGFGINADHRHQEKFAGSDRHPYTGRQLRLNAVNSDLFNREIGFFSHRKRTTGARRKDGKTGRNAIPITMTDRVVSVEPAGQDHVYDLSVTPTHEFGATGIVVHNCADDIDAFQSTNRSAFSTDVVLACRDRIRKPEGVYKLVGVKGCENDIPVEHWPDPTEIDRDKPRIPIDCYWGRFEGHYELVPVKFEGYSASSCLGRIFIWEWPRQGHEYGYGVDVAEGIGADRTTFELIRKDTLTEPDEQVCEFASDVIGPIEFWAWCMALGTLYSPAHNGERRQATASIEVRLGGGDGLQYELRKRGWAKFLIWPRVLDNKKINMAHATKLGFVTNAWSRPNALAILFTWVKRDRIKINSPYFIEEMEAFEKDEDRQSIRAAWGEHDDRIMAVAFILFAFHLHEIHSDKIALADQRESIANADDPVWDPGLQARDVVGSVGTSLKNWEILDGIYGGRR